MAEGEGGQRKDSRNLGPFSGACYRITAGCVAPDGPEAPSIPQIVTCLV
jgi:hypothetical protein